MIRKFASAAILEAQMGADAGFSKSAHRAVFNYTPRAGYLYVRSRAISSRCNDNFDAFPASEIEKSYLTFIGKPVFVNHHNDDHRRARGVIIDAVLHKDLNPDGSPDTWVELLHEVDAIKFPKLAKAILAGEVDRTSMGCDVQLSKCSACGNEATSPLEYCAHIPGKKGKKIYKVDPQTGQRTAQLIFEICSGLSFFENSLLVEAPADPTAYFLGGVEAGPGLEHLVASTSKTARVSHAPQNSVAPQQRAFTRTASRQPSVDVWGLLKQANESEWEGRAAEHGRQNDFVRGFEGRDVPDHGHPVAVYRDLSGAPKSGYPARGSWSIKHQNGKGNAGSLVQAHTVGLHITDAEPTFYEGAREHFKNEEKRGVHAFIRGNVHHYAEPTEHPQGEGWRQVSYYPDISHFFLTDSRNKYHGSDEAAFLGGKMWARGNIKEGDDGPVPQSRFEQPRTGKVWEMIHEASQSGDDLFDWDFVAARVHPEAHMAGQKHWNAMEPIVSSRPGMKDSDVDWFSKHPASTANIIDHYNQATDDEKEAGRRWYSEVGHGAAVLAKGGDSKLDYHEARHRGSGVVSAFSPQSEFHSNMLNAMTTFSHGSAPSSARRKSSASPADSEAHMAMESNSMNADRIVHGEHPIDVLAGHKTHAFYHNLAHGGQESSDSYCSCPNTHVTVDAHALSVACGKRIRAKEHGNPDLGDYHTYHYVANMYREATHHISQKEGRDIHPSEIQAVTWLARQRLNNDKAQTTKSNNTKQVLHQRLRDHGYDPEEIMGASKSNHQNNKMASGGYPFRHTAYGETKSPQDVDTLRSENCTVCGNSSAWDGTQCQVCGYVAPPRPFGDPNTDIAGQQDIRKQVLDGDQADPNDPNQQLGQQLGNPEEVEDQEDATAAGENTQMQTLTCDQCGTGLQPTPPETEGEPPYPAEGDVCPVCKKGQLLGSQDEEPEMDSVDAEEGQEGDAPGGSDRNDLEANDGDEDENKDDKGTESDDDNSEGEDSPFDKDKKQKKASSWKPVWWRS